MRVFLILAGCFTAFLTLIAILHAPLLDETGIAWAAWCERAIGLATLTAICWGAGGIIAAVDRMNDRLASMVDEKPAAPAPKHEPPPAPQVHR